MDQERRGSVTRYGETVTPASRDLIILRDGEVFFFDDGCRWRGLWPSLGEFMFTNKIYTGIGSRETPSDVLVQMWRIGAVLGNRGWTLRSGHADGADLAFERGAQHTKGKMEIFLPWEGFNDAKHDGISYFTWWPSINKLQRAIMFAEKHHPNWAACNSGAKKLHTRNVAQVVGMNLNLASDLIICWTKDGKGGGGTGQALRMAKALKKSIPIFDLAINTEKQIAHFINTGELP